jgi:hypothetical protein
MLTVASLLILWALVGYLVMLGLAALLRPKRALAFLFGFAQTRRANRTEGLLRLAAGLAFGVADKPLRWSPWGVIIGAFLALSAIALLLLPGHHRSLAPRLVGLVEGRMTLLGIGSLLLALLLALALIPL